MQKLFTTENVEQTVSLGRKLGSRLKSGEVIELASDLGGGKTILVKGLVAGFGSSDPVSSPSFTISNRYERDDGKAFVHYDFYRLNEPGIMAAELQEASGGDDIIAVEWAGIVEGVLPEERLQIFITTVGDDAREIEISYPKELSYLFKEQS